MEKFILTLFLAFMISGSLFAKRAPITLLTASEVVSQRTSRETSSPTVRLQVGIELGMIGRRQSTDADFLGVQSLIGARGFLWLPIYGAFTLKPSFGYFQKKETAGSVSVTQKHIEGGLGVLLTLIQEEGVQWHIGLSNRLTHATSTSAIYSSTSTSPAEVFLRSGPTTGILVRLGGRLHLIADFEYTWSFDRPTRNFLGLTSGLGFEI